MVTKTAPSKVTKKPLKAAANAKTRSYVSQEDVPSCSIDEALRVARAIADEYGGKATTPMDVAIALELQPNASSFRMACGASIAYGLTDGGAKSQSISLTDLGRRIVAPTEEGDDLQAKKEAVLRPRVFKEFLTKYDKSPLPKADIGINVLKVMQVPADRASNVFAMIVESAGEVGFLRQLKDKRYVDLKNTAPVPAAAAIEESEPSDDEVSPPDPNQRAVRAVSPQSAITPSLHTAVETALSSKRVFITHGKNMAFIEPIKKLLGFGEMEPVVSVEKQSVSKPVPEKVMEDMRSCGAAIIHVDGEITYMDKEANEHTAINPNVLIEIGAAMALYDRRFVLLVKEGVKLPSNLQGLFEVRYAGDALDGNATIRIMEAINEIKKTPLPGGR